MPIGQGADTPARGRDEKSLVLLSKERSWLGYKEKLYGDVELIFLFFFDFKCNLLKHSYLSSPRCFIYNSIYH